MLCSLPDEGQTVCRGPPDLQGQRLGELGLQLRSRCHQGLGSWDYLFFLAIGFVIFAAGTVSAWAIGVVMVLYERYVKKKSEQMDPDDEIEQDAGPGTGGGGGHHANLPGNGDLKNTGHMVV